MMLIPLTLIMKTLTVLTLNLNFRGNKHGSWSDRKRRIVELIRSDAPDIVALQAVENDGMVDQASELARELPEHPHVLFQSAERGAPLRGSAFLSRMPLAGFETTELPLVDQTEDPTPRVVIDARFLSAAGTVRVVNAHLSWVELQNEDNARRLVSFVSRDRQPALIVGDFNAAPDSPALRRLSEAGWKDLWSLRRAGDPGYTFESNQPSLRIDYAWADDGWAKRVREVWVAGVTPSGERISDHLALFVRFSAS